VDEVALEVSGRLVGIMLWKCQFFREPSTLRDHTFTLCSRSILRLGLV